LTNCVFAENTVTAGASGADLSGNNSGYNGGSAEGGGLYVPSSVTNAYMENSVFFQNTCTGGGGGSASGGGYDGGNGGAALGGGVASAAALMTIRNCTVASNTLSVGANGAGTGTNGSNGSARGWDICETAGMVKLSGSILSGGTNVTPNHMPNAYDVTDAGYNISTDSSLTRTSTNTLTNAIYLDLDTLVSGDGSVAVGPTDVSGPPFETEDITNGSLASDFVPGVPGVTFPATDGLGMPRGSPASAGAYEVNPITLDTNAAAPTVSSGLGQTNLTGAGATVTFTIDATSNDTNNNALGYQWQLNGTNLLDNNTFSGSTSPTLTINKLTTADVGMYQVVLGVSTLENITIVSNFFLIITNPVKITSQPASKSDVPVGSVVTFNVGVSGSPPFTFQWYSGTTPLADTHDISGSTTSNLTINPAKTNYAGSYYVVASNLYNSKTSAVATLTIDPVDTTKPTVSFTSPAAGARTNALVITGSASDNAQVTNVNYWVTDVDNGRTVTNNGMAGLSTNGTTTKTWSITNVFLPGTNYVTVQSVDYSGNVSTLISREFFYQVKAPFILSTNPLSSAGGVTGVASVAGGPAPTNGALLYIGEGYKLTAKPAKNWELTNWLVGTNIANSGTTLSFIMQSNLFIAANFVSIPETTKPTVVITSPKANSRSTMPMLSGTASDAVAVEDVAFWITNLNNGLTTTQSGLALLANGTSWSITNALLPGSNTLAVQSSNYAGLASTVVTATFFYEAPTPFYLMVNPLTASSWITGVAAVTGTSPSNGAEVNIGEGYKLTAKPAKNWVLLNWMEKTNIVSTNITLSFIMETNLIVTANFVSNAVSNP